MASRILLVVAAILITTSTGINGSSYKIFIVGGILRNGKGFPKISR